MMSLAGSLRSGRRAEAKSCRYLLIFFCVSCALVAALISGISVPLCQRVRVEVVRASYPDLRKMWTRTPPSAGCDGVRSRSTCNTCADVRHRLRPILKPAILQLSTCSTRDTPSPPERSARNLPPVGEESPAHKAFPARAPPEWPVPGSLCELALPTCRRARQRVWLELLT